MKKLNAYVMIVPVSIVVLASALIAIFSDISTTVISTAKSFLTNQLGVYYLIFGIAAVIALVVTAFSKIGKIKLGKENEKPAVNTFTWGTLIFTSTMAADILFYAFHEWTYYFNSPILLDKSVEQSEKILWSGTYSLFHWGFIPWSFYLLLAAAYAYMFYKRKSTNVQTMAEACRPILKSKTDGIIGKLINVLAVIGLLCGTSTTFSVATPLMTAIVCKLFGIQQTTILSIATLVLIAAVYTLAVLKKDGITKVARLTTIAFSFLLAMFLVLGNPRFIIENGLQSIGNMLQNFVSMSTWTCPTRATSFVQDWTIFYWAYWISWCVATPFFIAKISKGRTIKQVLLGGMLAGLLGTFSSFIVFGGFGMHAQSAGIFDAAKCIADGMSAPQMIVELISTINFAPVLLVVLFITMLGLYASTFDALTDVMSAFSYKSLSIDESASKSVKLFWAITFLVLPCALLFSNSTTQNLMSVSIIGALPLTIIMLCVFVSFIKSARKN